MEWKLDDSRPIWMQLEEQLTRRILSGWYKAGEKLPTVRDLGCRSRCESKYHAAGIGHVGRGRLKYTEPDDWENRDGR